MHHAQRPEQPPPSSPLARRSDAGQIRLNDRDLSGLTLVAEQYACPYDLLAAGLGTSEARVRGIMARWRRAGLAETGILSTGPAWVWLTPEGMRHAGYPWTAEPPAIARLADIRAVLACRLWLESGDAWRQWGAQWRCERHIRAATLRAGTAGHVPDAEVTWPPIEGSPWSGESWAIEVEFTAEAHFRVQPTLSRLLVQPYSRIVYLSSPAIRSVVTRAAHQFHPEQTARVTVCELPIAALARRAAT